MDLYGKRAIVVGAGKSGVAAARLLAQEGAEVLLNDIGDLKQNGYLEKEGVELRGGGHKTEFFRDKDLVVLSPGVHPGADFVKGALLEAKRGGAEIISEIELAAGLTKTPIIGITGTNGKSTTTTLLGKILERGGKKVFTGGNLGVPLSQYILDGDEADFIALELSSFQLERIVEFRPHIAIMLNISADHLDRYRSMNEYIKAKKRMLMNQCREDYAIINVADSLTAKLVSETAARVIPFSRKESCPGGVYLNGTKMISDIDGFSSVVDLSEINSQSIDPENLMSSFAASLICGIDKKDISVAINHFETLAHRMEFVAEVEGIKFFDDSKATNVGAVVKSLENADSKVILIAGGKDKGGSYAPLAASVEKHARGVVLIGEAAERIGHLLKDVTTVVYEKTMEKAVDVSWTMARKGDVIILSPACSSYDMFSDYCARGKAFKEAVIALKTVLENTDEVRLNHG